MKHKRTYSHVSGSAIVFSLLILSMLLSIAVSGATLTIAAKKSARGTEKSILAFQIADGATENVLLRIYDDVPPNDATLTDLANGLYGTANCASGVISGTLPSGTGAYTVTFLDNNDNKLQCSGAGYATYAEWRSKLVHLLVVGTFSGTTRAIDVGIKPYP